MEALQISKQCTEANAAEVMPTFPDFAVPYLLPNVPEIRSSQPIHGYSPYHLCPFCALTNYYNGHPTYLLTWPSHSSSLDPSLISKVKMIVSCKGVVHVFVGNPQNSHFPDE